MVKRVLIVVFAVTALVRPSAQTGPKALAQSWIDANASTLNRVNRHIWG